MYYTNRYDEYAPIIMCVFVLFVNIEINLNYPRESYARSRFNNFEMRTYSAVTHYNV